MLKKKTKTKRKTKEKQKKILCECGSFVGASYFKYEHLNSFKHNNYYKFNTILLE